MRYLLFPLCIACALFQTAAFAKPLVWTVTDGDFQTHVGELKSLNAGEVDLIHADGVTEVLPLSRLLRWSRSIASPTREAADLPEPRSGQTIQLNGVPMTITATAATAVTLQAADGRQTQLMTSAVRQLLVANAARNRRGPLALALDNDDLLIGEPIALDNTQLSWKNNVLGELKFPLERVRRLVRLPDKQPPASAPTEDIASLNNGDSVHGVVTGMASDSLTLQPLSGTATTIALDSLKQVGFAQTSAAPSTPQRGLVLSFVDGSRLSVNEIAASGAEWKLTRVDGTISSVSADSVRQVEQRGGPVVWLSDLTPTESTQQSFLGRGWPAQFNRTVDGGALTTGSQTISHGIGVHAYSKLVFDLPAGFDRLHIAYAIPGDAPYADATVRILLDGQAVLEATHVQAGCVEAPADIQLGDAKQLTLEVDCGSGQDTQDRLEWIEPALLRAVK